MRKREKKRAFNDKERFVFGDDKGKWRSFDRIIHFFLILIVLFSILRTLVEPRSLN